jgi:hypothetical protein
LQQLFSLQILQERCAETVGTLFDLERFVTKECSASSMRTRPWPLKFLPRVLLRGLALLTFLAVGWSVAAAQSAADISTAKPQLDKT